MLFMTQPASAAVSETGTLSHSDLIDRGGGPAAVGDALDPVVDGNTVKGWKRNNSIPGPYWQSFADAKLATLEELAAGAAPLRRAAVPGNDEQAPK